jgi:hypothetical protein
MSLAESGYNAYRKFLSEIPIVVAGYAMQPVEWQDLELNMKAAWGEAAKAILAEHDAQHVASKVEAGRPTEPQSRGGVEE